MIHEEDTTEIEIPGLKAKPTNIVRVDFASVPKEVTAPARVGWLKELDPAAPGIIRLLAVLTIVGLSLLIL